MSQPRPGVDTASESRAGQEPRVGLEGVLSEAVSITCLPGSSMQMLGNRYLLCRLQGEFSKGDQGLDAPWLWLWSWLLTRAEHLGSNIGSGRSPAVGNGNPLQHSCLEIPMDRGAQLAIVHGVTKGRTRLSDQ